MHDNKLENMIFGSCSAKFLVKTLQGASFQTFHKLALEMFAIDINRTPSIVRKERVE